MKPTPKRDLLAEVILERSHEPWSKYLYEHMFGELMPSEPSPSNVVQFPKRLSPERRRQILLAALERDDA
jgi:hypothetical protein